MGLDREQLQNAAIIYQVGQQVGASNRDIQIALIAAMTESNLRNVDYGDRDSLGLFQQRTSMDWGTKQQIMDPQYAARAFFKGAGTNQGLLDIKGRRVKRMGKLAQSVQKSAYPDRYQTHLPTIQDAFPRVMRTAGQTPVSMDGGAYTGGGVPGSLTNTFAPGIDPGRELDVDKTGMADYLLASPQNPLLSAPSLGPDGGIDDDYTFFSTPLRPMTNDEFATVRGGYSKGQNGWRNGIVELAQEYVGTPYVWGGDSPDGWDCSGFVQWVYGQMGIDLPRVSYQQANYGERVSLNKLQPGDLVAWDNSSRNSGADHIAIYLGNGRIIEAPRRGIPTRIRKLGSDEGAWGVRMEG